MLTIVHFGVHHTHDPASCTRVSDAATLRLRFKSSLSFEYPCLNGRATGGPEMRQGRAQDGRRMGRGRAHLAQGRELVLGPRHAHEAVAGAGHALVEAVGAHVDHARELLLHQPLHRLRTTRPSTTASDLRKFQGLLLARLLERPPHMDGAEGCCDGSSDGLLSTGHQRNASSTFITSCAYSNQGGAPHAQGPLTCRAPRLQAPPAHGSPCLQPLPAACPCTKIPTTTYRAAPPPPMEISTEDTRIGNAHCAGLTLEMVAVTSTVWKLPPASACACCACWEGRCWASGAALRRRRGATILPSSGPKPRSNMVSASSSTCRAVHQEPARGFQLIGQLSHRLHETAHNLASEAACQLPADQAVEP